MGKKILFYVVGISIACLGVTFILKSNAGAGPQDVVLMVLSEKSGLTFGTWVIISQGLFLLFNSLLLKKRPEFESVITMIFWGLVVDFWMEIVFYDLELFLSTAWLRWVCFLLGVLLIGIGVGIYLTPNLPRMPYDGMMVALCERFQLSLMASRTILEITFIIIGVLVGGNIGAGTIVLVVCIGTIIQFFNQLSRKIYTIS
ncbi:YczE/YyaS/YitT family protein [Niallia endozanthoxylica]|uniref:BCR, YitT family protein n=1 Tax=Niallia endozanthoxylica TaxID=2036016 RepID=A0A5J5I536_9BACI|nr:YitT family protein [Niallia endozanthoxylica]KAA9031604.1 BCR, YitT family protein [Niallia endozanthoxylica]